MFSVWLLYPRVARVDISCGDGVCVCSEVLYMESFLQTIKREWNGIDRLRMDKFLQVTT